MSNEDNRILRDRGARKKECRRCGFSGKVSDDELCRKCEEEVKTKKEVCYCSRWVEDDGAECDGCRNWIHRECEEMKQDKFDIIKGLEVWFCKLCSPYAKKKIEEQQNLRDENARMKTELQEVQGRNAEISKRMEQIENKWTQGGSSNMSNRWDVLVDEAEQEGKKGLREEMRELREANDELKGMIKALDKKWLERESEMIKRVTERVKENIEEMQNRESRKKNLIVFNVQESKKKEGEERQSEDKEVCEHIFQEVLGVRDAMIENVHRMGRFDNNKDRPMIVTMNEVGVKWAIVKKCRDLQEVENPDIKKVIIGVDQTRKEREESAILREELKKKRSQGGKWIIRKGKIIKLDLGTGPQRDNQSAAHGTQ
ncbi:hypothetical protein Pmani_001925 [Petrolisthes manimaculis]|uniref:PHD-type domain-containing protein n=1 Tax=Petrolisthes manimaculis TaxID=1843537 RepID=A0AAE1UNZ0_9EUCA|nr:hypothetical protein Pmani_001925 [Petrolisthes manimaculis]